ncbi:MAG: DUF4007 family protein [Treponema sp.]|nr:DUF4007 family protein [Treponema sp.]
MKFRAHETFFIRKGWLSKGMKYVKQTDGMVFIDKENNPMDTLGIGSNMVKSLRYWLLATGLTEENTNGKRIQTFTPLGKLVYENDRYMEESGTLQLLHYQLASNKEFATSWYYFFNEFSLYEFTQEDFITSIKTYVKMQNVEIGTERTFGDDFACIIGTYFSKKAGESENPENNISCPFSELGLINLLDGKKGLYKKSIPPVSSFDPYVILAIISDKANGQKEIKLNELLQGKNNIGRIFNLDTISMIEILRKAEKTEELKIIRTAGLDVVQLRNPENDFLYYVKKFYESLDKDRTE